MKWLSLNHNTIKMFSLGKIKWRIKFFCSKPGTILTVNLTTLMEWEGTHSTTVKILNIYIYLPVLFSNTWQVLLAFTPYLSLTIGNRRVFCYTRTWISYNRVSKKKKNRSQEIRGRWNEKVKGIFFMIANKSVGSTPLACELSFQKRWKWFVSNQITMCTQKDLQIEIREFH